MRQFPVPAVHPLVRTRFEQCFNERRIAFENGGVQRRIAGVADSVDIGAHLDQQRRAVIIIPVDGRVQRRVAVLRPAMQMDLLRRQLVRVQPFAE